MTELKYKGITAELIGASMAVHNELGSGFPERFYHRALSIELQLRKIKFSSEHYMNVLYKHRLIGKRRVDFFIEEKIMLEIKAISRLDLSNIAQAKNYLEAYNLEVGLLINFGALSLEFKRIQNLKYHPAPNQ
jgi:GxxExxY protein